MTRPALYAITGDREGAFCKNGSPTQNALSFRCHVGDVPCACEPGKQGGGLVSYNQIWEAKEWDCALFLLTKLDTAVLKLLEEKKNGQATTAHCSVALRWLRWCVTGGPEPGTEANSSPPGFGTLRQMPKWSNRLRDRQWIRAGGGGAARFAPADGLGLGAG